MSVMTTDKNPSSAYDYRFTLAYIAVIVTCILLILAKEFLL